jgi:hypothetical protein
MPSKIANGLRVTPPVHNQQTHALPTLLLVGVAVLAGRYCNAQLVLLQPVRHPQLERCEA